jgi:Na+/H+ antiporter NhaD and related arsenite permeases
MLVDYIITLILFLFAYFMIAFKNFLNIDIPIWSIFLIASVLLVVLNVIKPEEAYQLVNYDVIIFLFSMFTIGSALRLCGAIDYIIKRILSRCSKFEDVLLFVVIGIGVISGFLMNDTLALIATPMMLEISKKLDINPKVLLLALAFSVTTGSVFTPLGNPQNLLIALESGVRAPFITFLYYLSIPTLINLFILYYYLKIIFKKEINAPREKFKQKLELVVKTSLNFNLNRKESKITIIISSATFIAIILTDLIQLFGIYYLNISWISLIGATAILTVLPLRRRIIEDIDWGILIMFSAMFVLMGTVYNEGLLNVFLNLIRPNNVEIIQLASVAFATVSMSQIISNVPMTFLFLPIFLHQFLSSQTKIWVTLAWSSTIAGNLTILGAASNLIILEIAEKNNVKISYFEFFKYGSIITILNSIVLFLAVLILP